MSEETSQLAEIIAYPEDPVEFFKTIRKHYEPKDLTMNLATIDDEFGVLNRTVICRGIDNDGVIFATQQYTRNCKNLQANAKACITFYFPQLIFAEQSGEDCFTNWQVRLIDCVAIKLPEEKLEVLWQEEPLFAKIRAYICKCGEPANFEELKLEHDRMYNEYLQSDDKQIPRPESYTAYKFVPKRWDFYKSADFKIADRVQYRKQTDGSWQAMHIYT